MAKPIQPPSWAPDANPTLKGWESPQGELLISGRFTQDQVDGYNGVVQEIREVPETQPSATLLTEAPIGNVAIESMSKVPLEALGRENGVELDRRLSKKKLLQTIKSLLS